MKLVFVVGSGRCGSTLITELLAAHRDFGFISNIDDNLTRLNLMGRYNNFLFRSALGRFTKKGGMRYAPSEAYRLISEQVSPLYADSSRDLLEEDVTPWLEKRFRRFFEVRYRAQGKQVFLHKYTGWSRMGFFSRIFPEAKFIHVVRDGRAVANSWMQMPWWDGYRGPENWHWGTLPDTYQAEWQAGGQSYVLLAGICWKMLMDGFERERARLAPGSYLQIRYEDFLKDPTATLQNVLGFAELPWTPSFEASLQRQPVNESRSKAYEKDLTPAQLRELESSLGAALVRYGYEVAHGAAATGS